MMLRIALIAALLAPTALLAAGSDVDLSLALELARARRIRESKQKTPTPDLTPKKTTCGCGSTGQCTCYAGECQCKACYPNKKAAGESAGARPFSQVVATGDPIPVPTAATPPPPGEGTGSFAATWPAGTRINVNAAAQPGFTSNCPNGRCEQPQRRGLLGRR